MLTAYFEANRINEKARGILYRDFPEYYTWQTNGKFWQQRKKKKVYQIGRIVSAHPAEGERYYLRVLLNHMTGATSYEDLRKVDGKILPSFQEAAEKRGLIEADNTLDDCLTEAELFRMRSLYFVSHMTSVHYGTITSRQCLKTIDEIAKTQQQ
jgi:hypothetical protein